MRACLCWFLGGRCLQHCSIIADIVPLLSGSGTDPISRCLALSYHSSSMLLALDDLAAGVTTMVFALVFMLCYIGDVPQARGTIPLVIDAIWWAAGFRCLLLSLPPPAFCKVTIAAAGLLP